MKVTDVRDVPLAEWADAVLAARDGGHAYFDWLTAVDQSDAPEDAGLDVVCHLIDVTSAGSNVSAVSAGSAQEALSGGTAGSARRLASVLLRTRVPEGAAVASITGTFPGAAWHERETHEMFGLDFEGFDDGTGLGLRPLLLPDGFEGTPLRKSFVLAARASKAWPGAKEPGEGHDSARAPGRRRVQAPGVPGPEWGPRPAGSAP